LVSPCFTNQRYSRAQRHAGRTCAKKNPARLRRAGPLTIPPPRLSLLPIFLARMPSKPRISFDGFSKIEVSVGTVKAAERVPETDKLIKCSVDFGEAAGPRTIVSGIAAYVPDPSALVGRQFAYVTNLEPRVIKGIESNGMLFAVGEGDSFAFLT